jgi:hypothetical protein
MQIIFALIAGLITVFICYQWGLLGLCITAAGFILVGIGYKAGTGYWP